MAEQLSEDQIMELLRSQYPDIIPILEKPGVHAAIFQAVLNSYTPARLQAALQATEYYRTTNSADRAWDVFTTVDPQSAGQRLQQYQQKYTNLIGQTGITGLTPAQTTEFIRQAAANQWSDNEFQMRLVQGAGPQVPGQDGGLIAKNAADVMQTAQNYGVPISAQAALDYGQRMTAGAIDLNAVTGDMMKQAKSMYPNDPNLAAALDAGQTVAQYADPYKQIAVRELNMNPGDFNLSDPKWNSALSQVDPKTGVKVPQTLDQWQTSIRTDPKYGYDQTAGAQAQASQLVTQLGQKMGVL